METKNFKIFIDFDGTISDRDVGEAFVQLFGDTEKIDRIVRDWIDNKITSPESWFLMFDTFRGFSHEAFEKFLADVKIVPSFGAMVEYCRAQKFDMCVLSDGFDIYINKLLAREGFSDVVVYCNHAEVSSDNKIIPSFPHGDEECSFCGNCKRNHILTRSGDEDFIVYIGDGYSDKCPVQFCDFIFAKDSLLKYCEVNRITYFPFKDFNDVIKRLEELKNKKRLKKRHQAELKRLEVFKQG